MASHGDQRSPDCGARASRQGQQNGADPVADRRRDLAMGAAAKAGVGTLAAVLELYGTKRGDAQKAWGEARKRVDLIFKPLLSRPSETLPGRDFQILADMPTRRNPRPPTRFAACAWP